MISSVSAAGAPKPAPAQVAATATPASTSPAQQVIHDQLSISKAGQAASQSVDRDGDHDGH